MKRIATAVFALFLFLRSSAQDSTLLVQNALDLYPVLFQQTAAEYRALCYQAFNLARMRLDAIAPARFKKERLAIITDLDETILDNSNSEAQLILDTASYSDSSWKAWVSKASAAGVPGAVEFLQYAKKKGATIFYISNRSVKETEATLQNLKKLKLPDADTAHMLFLSTTSSKEERRKKVAQRYKVVMLLGDNLNDFTAAFEKKPVEERFAETDKVKSEWGKTFIVLPNAMYGEWENALFNYKRNLTPAQKMALLRQWLKGYR